MRSVAVLGERTRLGAGCDPQPSAGVLETQSVKTTSVGGVRSYDGATKLSERKRHLLVDRLGMVLKARVQTADLQDRAAVPLAVPLALEGGTEEFPRLKHLLVDQGYTGTGKAWGSRNRSPTAPSLHPNIKPRARHGGRPYAWPRGAHIPPHTSCGLHG
jgi:putative transposase